MSDHRQVWETLSNLLAKQENIRTADFETFVVLLCSFAPHICEEMWRALGHDDMVTVRPWPEFDAAKAAEDELEVPVQVNGKKRAVVTVPAAASDDDIKAAALAAITKQTEGKEVKKVICVGKGERKLVNVVVK